MDRVTFVVDNNPPHGLAWVAPPQAPDLTDDQARTIAIATLAGAIEKLADAVDRLADRDSKD